MLRLLSIGVLFVVVLAVIAVPVMAQDTIFDDIDDFLREYRGELGPIGDFLDWVESPEARVPVFGVGVALLLAGHAIFVFILFLQGFVIGAVIGAGADNDTILSALVSGVIGGVIAIAVYMLAIFFSGFVLGFLLGSGLFAGSQSADGALLIAFIMGIIGGFVALWLQKLIEILFTSAIGTLLIAIATGTGDSGGLLLLLFVIGVAAQYGWLMRHNPEALKPGFRNERPFWEKWRDARQPETQVIPTQNPDVLPDTHHTGY